MKTNTDTTLKGFTLRNRRFPSEKINVPAIDEAAALAFGAAVLPDSSDWEVVKERAHISMAAFFALPQVKAHQAIQARHPSGAPEKLAASQELRRLADQYCDDKGQSCATYFGEG